MNELIQYTEALLQEHECVTIPGFGAFVVQHHAAEVREGQLLPPRSGIAFNRALTHDDGLLANEYARRRQVNHRDAKAMLAADTAQLTQTLHERKHLPLCRIGDLREEGERWVFSPSACTFLPQNLGFSPISLPQQEEARIVIRLRRDYVHYAAACVLGLCLLAVSPKGSEGRYADYAALNPVNFTEIVLSRQAAEAPAEEAPAPLPRGHFHIVVASLDMPSAEAFRERLASEGHTDATILPYKKNLHRVVIASYVSKRDALHAMEQLRRNSPYKRAWVYCEPS